MTVRTADEIELREQLFAAMDGNLRMSRRRKLLDDYRDAILAAASAAGPATPAPTDHTGLRDRIAETLYPTYGQEDRTRSLAIADAVLTVLPTAVDPAAVYRDAADHLARQADELWAPGTTAHTVMHADAAELRRMAGETAATQTPAVDALNLLTSALLNPDRPATLDEARVFAAHALGIHARELAAGHKPAIETALASPLPTAEALAEIAAQPAGADVYEQTTGHLATCLAVAGGTPDPECPCTAAAQPAGGQQCVCGDPIEWSDYEDGEGRLTAGWVHSPGSNTPCLNARPAGGES